MTSNKANADYKDSLLSASYPFNTDSYHEMYEAQGGLRKHWQYLGESLDALGLDELQRRYNEADRLIRDNDVTYNVYTDPQGMGRPWDLDLIPLLIESEEWSRIEAGLMQRAELLNLLLEDLYGERTVISKGIIPPQLIYGYKGFLHPCDNISRRDRRYLHLYAADLARLPNGEMCVIADRTQAPSGAGYALENRIVSSRVLPSLFRDSHVHRLAAFFRSLRLSLEALAPEGVEDPNVVLLSPGSDNETYFEHAYLANYLGYTLVEGTDLTVRDDKVWLKTLDGLQAVDVILRRVDDAYCDPLELRGDSFLGVPGLLQAVRDGVVTVCNPLGSGVLQNPALMAFMPEIAEHFLGRDLQLGNTRTWWCGVPEHLSYVLAHIDELVIKPINPRSNLRMVFGETLLPAERRQLLSEIRSKPYLFCAQQRIIPSSAPILGQNNSLESRQLVIRSFLAVNEDSYNVMPGGLSRVSQTADQLMVSSQQGGISKDTWVLASEPEKEETLLVSTPQISRMQRAEGDVPSRVADNLYWIGRYAERAEGLLRLLRVIQGHLIDPAARAGRGESGYCLHQLLRAVTWQTRHFPGFVSNDAGKLLQAPETELLKIISDADRPGSLSHTLSALLFAARSVRDRLSVDTLRVINDIDRERNQLKAESLTSIEHAFDEIDNLVTSLVALSGLVNENMTHGQGWRFLQIGKRMERAIHTASLLRSTLVNVAEHGQDSQLLESLLSITDSLMTYKRRYRSGLQVGSVLELILHDESNPRSIGYQLLNLQQHTSLLPNEVHQRKLSSEQKLVLDTLNQLRLADTETLTRAAPKTDVRSGLDDLLVYLLNQLPELFNALSMNYFQKEETIQQLVNTQPGGNR